MKKMYKACCLFTVFILCLNMLGFYGYALNTDIQDTDEVIKYNGTVEDLPEYIYDSYMSNEKAESLDIYDSSLYSVTTNNSDGTKTIELYQTPIKYIEEDEVKFIDTAIENASLLEQVTNQFFYKCETTPVKTFYPKHLLDGVSIENGEYGVECYPNTTDNDSKKLFSKPILSEKNTVVYESVFGDTVDVSYTPLANGLKEEIILNKRPDSNIFEFKVELENLQPIYLTGDSIPLKDKDTGEQVAAISQIDMRDSASETTYNTSLFNHLELELIEDNTYILKVILDDVFLKAETTVYPVIVDPTITFNADPIYDAPVFSGYPSTNFNSNTYNVVGYHGSTYGEGIGFVKINNIQNYLYIRPENITSAYLKVYESSGKTSTAKIGVYNTKATWSNTSITYNNNKPSLNAEPYSSLTVTNSGWYTFDISGFIRNWLRFALNEDGKSQEYGLALKMLDTGVSSRHFCSANHSSYPPSIIINYTEYTGLEEGNYIIRSQYHPEAKPYCYLYASGSNVVQYTAKGNANQIWKVDYIGGGYYEIYSTTNSSLAMGVASSEPSNATNVGLYDSSAGNRRKFRIIKNADGSYRILSICGNKNKGLDVCGPSNAAGTNIQTWEYSGVTQQQWNFYKAAPCGYLNYWYSDSTQIGHQKNNNIKVYVVADSGFGKSTATLKTYVSFAMEAWKALGYTYTFVNSPEDSNICVRGIDRDTALSIDAVKGDTASGLTTNIGKPGTTSSYDGQSFSPDGWKSVYTLTKKTVYIIWDSSLGEVNTSLFNRTKWETVVTHEIGHALGHEGHNEEESIMMSLNKNLFKLSRSTPQIMDFNHLNQVY